jgi:hypothetical protein
MDETAESNHHRRAHPQLAPFWLISHQPAVLFSQNKPATSNQPTVLFSQNKSAPAIRHQPNEQAVDIRSDPWVWSLIKRQLDEQTSI